MSRIKYCTALGTVTAGLLWSFAALSPVAHADIPVPASPGVPCMYMVQQLASTPPTPPAAALDATSIGTAPVPATRAENVVEAPPAPAAPLPGGPVEAAAETPPAPAIPVAASAQARVEDQPRLGDRAPGDGEGHDQAPAGHIDLPPDLICAGAAWALLNQPAEERQEELARAAEEPVSRGEW